MKTGVICKMAVAFTKGSLHRSEMFIALCPPPSRRVGGAELKEPGTLPATLPLLRTAQVVCNVVVYKHPTPNGVEPLGPKRESPRTNELSMRGRSLKRCQKDSGVLRQRLLNFWQENPAWRQWRCVTLGQVAVVRAQKFPVVRPESSD